MEQINLFIVLQKLMKESNFQCEWGVEWQEEQYFLKVILQFELDNPNQLELYDPIGNKINEEKIPFETQLVFFEAERFEITSPYYIKAISVDSNQGIAYSDVVAIVKYLKKLSSMVRINWLEYLEKNETKEFKLEWKDRELEAMRQQLMISHRYSYTPVFFPKRMGYE